MLASGGCACACARVRASGTEGVCLCLLDVGVAEAGAVAAGVRSGGGMEDDAPRSVANETAFELDGVGNGGVVEDGRCWAVRDGCGFHGDEEWDDDAALRSAMSYAAMGNSDRKQI